MNTTTIAIIFSYIDKNAVMKILTINNNIL